jgi:hypothetical protein
VLELLLSKGKALNSNPTTTKEEGDREKQLQFQNWGK